MLHAGRTRQAESPQPKESQPCRGFAPQPVDHEQRCPAPTPGSTNNTWVRERDIGEVSMPRVGAIRVRAEQDGGVDHQVIDHPEQRGGEDQAGVGQNTSPNGSCRRRRRPAVPSAAGDRGDHWAALLVGGEFGQVPGSPAWCGGSTCTPRAGRSRREDQAPARSGACRRCGGAG